MTSRYTIRKTTNLKNYFDKQTNFHSPKKYSTEIYKDSLRNMNFPNYELILIKSVKTLFKIS